MAERLALVDGHALAIIGGSVLVVSGSLSHSSAGILPGVPYITTLVDHYRPQGAGSDRTSVE